MYKPALPREVTARKCGGISFQPEFMINIFFFYLSMLRYYHNELPIIIVNYRMIAQSNCNL
jgi:hypothetical protein